jgi:hypothetical protein
MEDTESWTGTSWRMARALTKMKEYQMIDTPLPIIVMLPAQQGDLVPGVQRPHLEYGDYPFPFALCTSSRRFRGQDGQTAD